MAINIRFNSDFYKHYEIAMNKAKVEIVGESPVVTLTAENFEDTVKALEELHNRLFKQKTKKAHHIEQMFSLEHLLSKIKPQAVYFPAKEVNNEEVVEETPLVDEVSDAGWVGDPSPQAD